MEYVRPLANHQSCSTVSIGCRPCGVNRDEEDGILVAKEAIMEKRKVQQAVEEWEAEKRQRIEDGEEGVEGGADEEDVQDVQVQYMHVPGTSMIQPQYYPFREARACS